MISMLVWVVVTSTISVVAMPDRIYGNVRIRLVAFGAKWLTQGDGSECCKGCTSCGNYFDVCYSKNEENIKVTCEHTVRTGVLLTRPRPRPDSSGNVRIFSPDESLGNGVVNPILLPFFEPWTGNFGLQVDVWNNYTDGLIAEMYHKQRENSFSTIFMNDGKFERILVLSWDMMCSRYFHGDNCSHYCKPRNDNGGHYRCLSNGTKICLPGWTNPGIDCRQKIDFVDFGDSNLITEVDECLSQPCHNGGICNDSLAGFFCACSHKYTGTYCQTEIHDCSPTSCLNEASCYVVSSQFVCDCAPGYCGRHCEFEINECSSSPCPNNTHCIDGVNYYVCAYGRTNSSDNDCGIDDESALCDDIASASIVVPTLVAFVIGIVLMWLIIIVRSRLTRDGDNRYKAKAEQTHDGITNDEQAQETQDINFKMESSV